MSHDSGFENTLERLLSEASQSAAARPHFYRELLEASVLICPHGEIESEDPAKDTATLKMAAITHEGIPYIPFYLAEKFLPRGMRYASLPARTFFEITKGSHLVLNPGAPSLKTFTPAEIERLLSGRLLDVEGEFKVSNNAAIHIGEATEVPDGLLGQLTKFFDAEPAVLRAWLAWYHNPTQEKIPGYLLAIETVRGADFRSLAGRATLVIKEVGTRGHYCDIVQYEGSGMTRYFRSARPFYAKSRWERLKGSVFG